MKDTMTMTRWELITALRSFAPPNNYQELTRAPNAVLCAALAFYASAKHDKPDGVVSILVTPRHE